MEDRLKIRAWDKTQKKMWTSTIAMDCLAMELKFPNTYPDWIWMQSTGAKHNNRSVFESDIYELKVHGIETHVEFIECVVEWSPQFYCLAWKRFSEDTEQQRWFEIGAKAIIDKKHLGNIHEKPELLKGE